MTPAGLRLLHDLRRALFDPPTPLAGAGDPATETGAELTRSAGRGAGAGGGVEARGAGADRRAVVEVVAAEFLLLVPLPVLVEVAVGDDGAQVQDGFGARGGPPRAGDVHPVL